MNENTDKNTDKNIRFQFVGTFEVLDEDIKVKFNHEGKTLDEFRDLVGKLISIEYSQYHHGTAAAEQDQTSKEFNEGIEAFSNGKSVHYNPYRNSMGESREYNDWHDGWAFSEQALALTENNMDMFQVRNTMFKAMDYLRNIEAGRDGECEIDNSGFCQKHMAYTDDDPSQCFYKKLTNFVDQFDARRLSGVET